MTGRLVEGMVGHESTTVRSAGGRRASTWPIAARSPFLGRTDVRWLVDLRQDTAIDHDLRAVDERGVLRGEEHADTRDLVRRGDTAQWVLVLDRCARGRGIGEAVEVRLIERRVDIARTDAVRPNALADRM